MEFLILLIPVFIAGVAFFVITNKKSKSRTGIVNIKLTKLEPQRESENKAKTNQDKVIKKETKEKIKKAEKPEKQTKSETSKKSSEKEANNSFQLKSQLAKDLSKESKKPEIKIDKEIDKEQKKLKLKKNIQSANQALSKGIKKMKLIESISSFFKTIFVNQNQAEHSSSREENKSQKLKEQAQFEIAIYLKSTTGEINGRHLLPSILSAGFKLIAHNIGYCHRALIIQEQNGDVINRLNIETEKREQIKIYFDPNSIDNEQDLSEAIGVTSHLAKELNCQILNYKQESITKQDLADIEQVIFNKANKLR